MAMLCLPQVVGHVPTGAGPVLWMLLLAREVAVGASVGFVASCFFRGIEAAGRFTDIVRGANMAEVISPVSEGPSGDTQNRPVVDT
jgi:flagellar biosynthetic protein FliR